MSAKEKWNDLSAIAYSKGWEIFIVDIKKEIDINNDVLSCNESDLERRKGKLEMCQFIIDYMKRAEQDAINEKE